MLCAKYNLQSEQTFETPCIIQENHMTMTLIKQQSQTKQCAVFKAISKSSKLEAIPHKVTAHLQPIRVLLTVRFSF